MDAIRVYEGLDSIKQGNADGVNQDTVSFLHDNGLVSLLSESDYRKSSSEVERLPRVREEYDSQSQLASEHRSRAEELDRKLSSKWHRFWSSNVTLDREQREREDKQSSYETAERNASEHGSEVKRLEGVQSDLEGYTQVDDGYAKPTDKVKDTLSRLKARLPRLEGVSYREFVSELEQVRGALDYRYQRFRDMWSSLLEKDRGNRKETVQLAIALSKLSSDFDETYDRFRAIHRKMWGMNWKGFEAYRIVANVVAQEGDIDDLWERLLETRNALCDRGAYKTYTLWSDAANIMKIPGDNPIARYDELGAALFGDYWKPNANIPTKIQANSKQEAERIVERCRWNVFRRTAAANLARLTGDAGDIAQGYHSLKKEIHDAKWRKCLESNVAALFLMGSQSPERVARFGEAFESMHLKGWSRTIQWFPTAAAISLMPGTVEENVQWLLDVYHKFKKDYKGTHTSWATSLLVGGYSSLPNAPEIWVDSGSAYEDADGFDIESAIGGAVIGDLLDNGSLDFSDGAVAGGIVGGLLGDPITGGLVGLLFDDD